MKTIGIIGGMSWESTTTYYALINEYVKQSLGGLHSAQIILSSVDFAEVVQHQKNGDDNALIALLQSHARRLETAGVDYIAIATNTMHMHAEQIMQGVDIPLLHIVDATAQVIQNKGYSTVGLLGTMLTMNESFYKDKLREERNITALTPSNADKEIISNIIYNELCLGMCKDSSLEEYIRIMEELHNQGAQAIILGCTEIGLLVSQQDTSIPLLDTTSIHAQHIAQTIITT